MRKILSRLYHKYCHNEIKSIFLEGIQRDFSGTLTPEHQRKIAMETRLIKESETFKFLLNQELKKYLEIYLSNGISEEAEYRAKIALASILDFQESVNMKAADDALPEDFDPNNPL